MGESVFIDTFGNTPYIRVLEMLLLGRGLDYSISDIARRAKVTRVTFYKMLDKLKKEEIIIPTRRLGNMQLYTLNVKNPVVKEILRVYMTLGRLNSEAYFKTQSKKKTVMKFAVSH
ncbi:MAG: hypothetical protein A2675_02815 [Candidatus Yonathbacteria bacterium RIFCSPHIGHO2_01_FULL_51_10]|uniref:HTH arsR-type domain-containing protein n=1 Tax=Candidatus Yonathbacteria bacterium RIFCSPHIGHO2_01_FULL_51_10 TaxID=1802723 RepID=A0A1G2SAH6_9BACT|nr:MAG: hypothetical protein A2675_02815 [Candidatus Yonathbacteria bacterium RIFCSPHIGHO2_01_FULL_51_10]